MSEIRAIFDSANIFTTDGELLTSLLLPYVKVDPSKPIETRCDWWHHRDPEGEAYDIMWIWDRYLRALLNVLYFSVSTALTVNDVKRWLVEHPATTTPDDPRTRTPSPPMPASSPSIHAVALHESKAGQGLAAAPCGAA
jgi:hypothetical protein